MNKKKYLLMFVATIAASFGFTACSSENDVISPEQQQTLGEAIKAQFTISIPTEAKGMTRQSSTIVNADGSIGNFRGITFIKLYPSSLTVSDFDAASTIGKNTALTNLIIPATSARVAVSNYIPKDKLTSANNSVLYGDVQMRIGTKSFLFYGMAIGKTESGTAKAWNATEESYTQKERFINGFLAQNGLVEEPANVSGISFSPVAITTSSKSDAKRTAIISYLNAIANTTGWSASTDGGLQAQRTAFTGMTAGSSTNLEIVIRDLYFAMKSNTDAVSQAICSSIKDTEVSTGVKYVTIDEDAKTLTFNAAIDGYPSVSDGLPDGAAVLSWADASGFSYTTQRVSTSDMAITNLESYVYPACLYYWGKSDILTSRESQLDLYKTKSWDEIVTAFGTDAVKEGNAISSRTRSVVLKDPVQYAVGRLDISVKATASGSTTPYTLTDAGTGTEAISVDVSKLKLTGILIGGQKSVDWKFEPTGNAEYTIYDNIKESNNAAGLGIKISNASDADAIINHTLVLESSGKVGDVDDKVKVALEFENNDKEFLGATGIVPPNTKFYLVGELDAKKVEADEYNKTGGKVFKQDYVTIAKFTVNSLKSAINTIPDLRNPQVELGLSVNLSWKEGISFPVVIQ